MSEQRFDGRELNRRDFLALAGCGGGPQNNPAAQGGIGGGGGKEYNGPKVNLEFWNGFTGGDGRESSVFASLPQQRQFAKQLPYVHFPRRYQESAMSRKALLARP